jgi:hypothetical protein
MIKEKTVIQEVVDKANRAFLWVLLAVGNRVIGLKDGNTDKELKERLDSLYLDLKNPFARIIQQILLNYVHGTIKYVNMLKFERERKTYRVEHLTLFKAMTLLNLT